jgi:hypothetical protein
MTLEQLRIIGLVGLRPGTDYDPQRLTGVRMRWLPQ